MLLAPGAHGLPGTGGTPLEHGSGPGQVESLLRSQRAAIGGGPLVEELRRPALGAALEPGGVAPVGRQKVPR